MDPIIIAAALAAIPPTMALFLSLGRAKRTEAAVGTPNGQGNLAQMMERLLHGQAAQDERLARLENDHNQIHSRIDHVEYALHSTN